MACMMGYSLKSPEQGVAVAAPFIRRHIIEAADKAFDDFAGAGTNTAQLRKMLGVSS